MTGYAAQNEADALINLWDKDARFTVKEFSEALGVSPTHGHAFIQNAKLRGMIVSQGADGEWIRI